jgi:Ribbon-helix-helix domain
MIKKRPKPSIANPMLIKSLQDNNLRLNLIDGEEDNFSFTPNSETLNQSPSISENNTENTELNKTGVVKVDDSEINEDKQTEAQIVEAPVSKKRNNVPIYEDQYWGLNAISKATSISITQLVREGLDIIIEKYNEEFGVDINRVKEIQHKLRGVKNSK